MLIVVGLVVAFALIAWYRWRYPGTRQCRWRADLEAGLWHCTYCGARAPHDPAGPPRACLRPTRKDST
jgi:hypothetical protein